MLLSNRFDKENTAIVDSTGSGVLPKMVQNNEILRVVVRRKSTSTLGGSFNLPVPHIDDLKQDARNYLESFCYFTVLKRNKFICIRA